MTSPAFSARIEADAALTPVARPELKWEIEMVLQIMRLGVDKNGQPPASSQASYTLDGAVLTVTVPESLHPLAGRVPEHLAAKRIRADCREL